MIATMSRPGPPAVSNQAKSEAAVVPPATAHRLRTYCATGAPPARLPAALFSSARYPTWPSAASTLARATMTAMRFTSQSMSPVCPQPGPRCLREVPEFPRLLPAEPSASEVQQRHGQLTAFRAELAVAREHVHLAVVDDARA